MKKDIFSFDYCIKDGASYYFSSNIFNGLIKYDSITEKTEYRGMFEGYPLYKQGIHNKVYEFNNKLFFCPNNIRDIHIYDMDRGTIERISLGIEDLDKYRSIDSVFLGNKIWLIGAFVNSPLISYDVQNGEIDKYESIFSNLSQEITDRDKPLFWSKVACSENCIYGAVWGNNHIVKIDLIEHTAYDFCLQNCEWKISGISILDDRFYFTLLGTDGVGSCDKEFGNCKLVNPVNGLDFTGDNTLVYSAIIPIDEGLLLVPNDGEEIYRMYQGEIVSFLHLPDGYRDVNSYGRKLWRRTYDYRVTDHNVEIFPCRGSMYLNISTEDGTVEGRNVVFDDDEYGEVYRIANESYYMNGIGKEGLISESELFTVRDYAKFVNSHK